MRDIQEYMEELGGGVVEKRMETDWLLFMLWGFTHFPTSYSRCL